MTAKGPTFRPRSHQDRDTYVDKRTPPKGVEAIPEPVFEDITGLYSSDPERLRTERRKRRTTGERLEHLETKYDALVHKTIDSRTKIIIAIVSAVSAALGYLMGGCT